MSNYPQGCAQMTSGGIMFNYLDHTLINISPGRLIEFDEDIDPAIMEQALEQARQRYPQLSLRICADDTEYRFAYNERPFTLLPLIQGFRWFGSEELNRHLLHICYQGRILRLDYFHGLADGTGFLCFVRTLLYYYLTGRGYQVDTQGLIRTNETEFRPEEANDPGLALLQAEAHPFKVKPPGAAFSIPGPLRDAEQPHVKYRMELDLSRVKGLAKKYEATPVCLVAPLFSRALYTAYVGPDAEYAQPIVASVPVNLRAYFPSETVRSFSNSLLLAYPRRLEGKSLDMLLTTQRGSMDLQLDRDGLISSYQRIMGMMEQLFRNPQLSREAKVQTARTQLGPAMNSAMTYLITNIGQVQMPPDILAHVRRLETLMPCAGCGFTLAMSSTGPLLNIALAQRTEDSRVAKLFCEYLGELEIPASFSQEPDYYYTKFEPALAAGQKDGQGI